MKTLEKPIETHGKTMENLCGEISIENHMEITWILFSCGRRGIPLKHFLAKKERTKGAESHHH